MRRDLIRKFGAVSLISSVWFSAVVFLPVGVTAQTPDAKKQVKEDKKKRRVTSEFTPREFFEKIWFWFGLVWFVFFGLG